MVGLLTAHVIDFHHILQAEPVAAIRERQRRFKHQEDTIPARDAMAAWRVCVDDAGAHRVAATL
jgi:hypothetical protein